MQTNSFLFIFRRYIYIAYRQLVQWGWTYLDRKVRIPLPSCAVTLIRKTFHAESGDYTGFKYPRISLRTSDFENLQLFMDTASSLVGWSTSLHIGGDSLICSKASHILRGSSAALHSSSSRVSAYSIKIDTYNNIFHFV